MPQGFVLLLKKSSDDVFMTDQRNPLSDRVLTWFMVMWIGLVVLANVVAVAGQFLTVESFGEAWSDIAQWYGPFNFLNLLVQGVALSPAIIAYWVRGRLRKRRVG